MRKKKRRGKQILIIAAVCCITICLIHIISMLTLDKTIEYKEIIHQSCKISSAFDGYRIAFITDTHAMTASELEQVAASLNQLELDLLLLGGDFPSSPGAPERSMEILSQIQTVDGIYGIEGNHDNYIILFDAMETYGIRPLSNSGTTLRQGLYLAGVEDLWNRNPDISKAAAGARPGDFVLLLSHNPDVSMEQDTSSVDLILSGHTHGGQITFFGLWAPELTLRKTITEYGQRFMSGWAESGDGTPVYISNGTGYLQSVPRIFARPQVILLTLVSE